MLKPTKITYAHPMLGCPVHSVGPCKGSDGKMYRSIHIDHHRPALSSIEIYEVTRTGLEMFLGYATPSQCRPDRR